MHMLTIKIKYKCESWT